MEKHNPLYDPLGIEIFAIDETFESLFNGLAGVYFRLYYKEYKRPEHTRNIERENEFYKRFGEIRPIKNSYRFNDWEAKKKAVEEYSPEFRKMIAIELKEYATIS
jgi:hypothetical protein